MPKGERGTARPFLRGKIWWIQYYVPGESKPRRESSESTDKRIANRLLNQRRKEIDDRQITPGDATVGDLLELYLTDQRQQKRSSYRDAEGYVRIHLRPAFGKIKAAGLTSAMISRFIEQKQAKGLANASINRFLSGLRRAFTLGIESLPPLVSVAPSITKLEEN